MADPPDPPITYASYDTLNGVEPQQVVAPDSERPPDDFDSYIDALDLDVVLDVYTSNASSPPTYTGKSTGGLTSTLRSDVALSMYSGSELSETPSASSGQSVSRASWMGPLTPPTDTGTHICNHDPCALSPLPFGKFPIPTSGPQYGYGYDQQQHHSPITITWISASDELPVTAQSPFPLLASIQDHLQHHSCETCETYDGSYVSCGACGDGPHTLLCFSGGAIDPSLLSFQGIPLASPPEGLDYGQEQSRLQHSADAAMADALGLGIAMPIDWNLPHPSVVPNDPAELPVLPDVPPSPMEDDVSANVPKHPLEDGAKPPAKRRRPQSTEKRFLCTYPGCKEKSARKNNIDKHFSSVHKNERPFRCELLDCPKFVDGYSRRSDLNIHLAKIHGCPCKPKGSKG